MELLSSSQTCKLTHWSRPGGRTCSSTSPKTRSVALATRRATVLQQGISMWVFLFHPSAAIPHISYHRIEFFLHSAEVRMKCENNLFDPWLKVNSVLDCPPCDHGDVLQRYPYIFQPLQVLQCQCRHKTWLYYKKYPRKSVHTNFCCCKTGVIWESANGWIANDTFWVERWIV